MKTGVKITGQTTDGLKTTGLTMEISKIGQLTTGTKEEIIRRQKTNYLLTHGERNGYKRKGNHHGQ